MNRFKSLFIPDVIAETFKPILTLPEFIIKNGLRILGKDKKYFFEVIDKD